MEPLGFHLVFRLQDDRVLAPSRALRRLFARKLTALCRAFPLLAWRVVDTHLHMLGLLTRAQVDELARRLRIMVARIHPGVPLWMTVRKPVNNQWHLAEAFDYVLRQDSHHAVGSDPHHDGSCLADLLGLRVIGSPLASRVREHLPRVTREQLVAHLGIDALGPAVDMALLADAAAAAHALADLHGRHGEVVAARAAAVHAATGAASRELADALGVTSHTVRRLAAMPRRELAVAAVRLQVGLRRAQPDSGPNFAAEPVHHYRVVAASV